MTLRPGILARVAAFAALWLASGSARAGSPEGDGAVPPAAPPSQPPEAGGATPHAAAESPAIESGVARPSAVPETVARRVELGAEAGVVARGAADDTVKYSPAFAWGGSARTDIVDFLFARLSAHVEKGSATPKDGSLGIAGARFGDADLTRTYLAVSVEPTWSPVPRLELFAGAGAGWGRTVCRALHSENADNVVVPTRAAVFVDFDVALGVRHEILRDWLVVQGSVAAGLPTLQSGTLLTTSRTPDQAGRLGTASAFPELGPSFTALAGLGVLL